MLNDPTKESAIESLTRIPLPKDICFCCVPLEEFDKEQLIKICGVVGSLLKQEQEGHLKTFNAWEFCRKHRL